MPQPINSVTVPIYQYDSAGDILPNPLFHRSWNRLHSRTIEYPFAASQVKDAQAILDIGSVKADEAWLNWLESLPIDVYATDYDADSDGVFKNTIFHQCDVRQLPFEDNLFDVVLAVSVIEHIGLEYPQVNQAIRPQMDKQGDVAAVRELMRVLKPNGRLVMTFPFGKISGLSRNGTARTYDIAALAKFDALAQPIIRDYYEYQHNNAIKLFAEQQTARSVRIKRKLKKLLKRIQPNHSPHPKKKKTAKSVMRNHVGKVTWRKRPIEQAQASNTHTGIEGILCGVWRKASR